MGLEDQFNQAVTKWKGYLQQGTNPSGTPVAVSSRTSDFIACEAYRTIVSMGATALPLIRRLYDTDSSQDHELATIQGHGLPAVVHEIIGSDFQIPKEIRGRISLIEEYTKTWLDAHLAEYVP